MRIEIIFEKINNSAEYGKMLDVTIKSTKHSGALLFGGSSCELGIGSELQLQAPLSFPLLPVTDRKPGPGFLGLFLGHLFRKESCFQLD